jgi:hypothetical protein
MNMKKVIALWILGGILGMCVLITAAPSSSPTGSAPGSFGVDSGQGMGQDRAGLSSEQELTGLRPRQPLAKEAIERLAPEERVAHYRLIVKFADALKVRATANQELRSLRGASLHEPRQLASKLGLKFAPLIHLPESKLNELQRRAALHSGVAQPDLAGIVNSAPQAASAYDALVDAAEAFQRLPQVEFAYVEVLGVPPPGDITPTTPSLVAEQTYRLDNPGMSVDAAWSLGATGRGVRISDCEYGWNSSHEDLMNIDLHPEPGQTIDPAVVYNGWDEHGTAAMGEISAEVNAYGCSGMAPDATIYTYPEYTLEGGNRRVDAITNAISDSAEGDIVQLEMQGGHCSAKCGPAELDAAVWTIVRLGSDAGVIVVAAAGNGGKNLDLHLAYMARGDSGAILVGAGQPDVSHKRLRFSSFGTRVDLQGWGENVITLGYGDYATYGDDKNQRYTSFSGTSSATPFVSAACAALQQIARDRLGRSLTPQEMHDILIQTGQPQRGIGHIGPLPNIPAAIKALDDL